MDLKANKVDITPSSVSTTKLIANEWNQLVTENMNVITTGGELIPSSKDRKQMVASIEKISEDKTKEVMFENYDDVSWTKPADWIDIRSGAIPNSVYFLVGHSADYATYPTFVVKAGVSNSGTYDVFVDGIKQANTASGTETTLNWQTLALESGWDVTYPAALKTHVVRVTPTLNTNNLTSISTGSISDKGILWAHFTTTNYISLANFAQSSTSPNANTQAPVWESVTAENNELNVNNISCAFSGIRSLKNIPTLIAESNQTATNASVFITRTQIKKVKLVNVRNNGGAMFRYCPNLEEINLENCLIGTGNAEYILQDANNLRKMPSIDFSNSTSLYTTITKMPKLEPTFLDFSVSKSLKSLGCYGTYDLRSYGIKGIIVSNEAPFDSTTSPQINVAYTGMDRNALVNLFKSMPTVSASQVCHIVGTTGAADLTAEDLAIATNKGWTITR